jgi:hypothetical protein
VRSLRPDIPEAVEAIVRRALERDPARRFGSAADMGEACEHHLYDKGYGPTNLTLKRYVSRLFPEAAAPTSEASFPLVDATLLPLFEAKRKPRPPSSGDGDADVTPAAPLGSGPAYTRVVAQRPQTTVRPETTARAARTLPVATVPLAELPGATPAPPPSSPGPRTAAKSRRLPAPRRRKAGRGRRAR